MSSTEPQKSTDRFVLASRLYERKSQLSKIDAPMNSPISAAGNERAKKRLKRWEERLRHGERDGLSAILKIEKMSTAEFETLLSEDTETLTSRLHGVDWHRRFVRAFNVGRTLEDPRIKIESAAINGEYISSLWPLIRYFHLEVDEIEPILFRSLIEPLLMKLSRLLQKSMILELNIARLEGDLQAPTPEERYKEFFRNFTHPEFSLDFFSVYPVLARSVFEAFEQWACATREFLARVANDRAELDSFLNDPGLLVNVQGNLGDAHRQGRSVLIAEFESGAKIVYKPRSMQVDHLFQRALRDLNDHQDLQMKVCEVFDHGSYGWMEFVEVGECRDEAEAQRFHRRLGVLTAVFYAFNGTDLHLENVLACGEFPVVVDLETIFHPVLDVGETMVRGASAVIDAKSMRRIQESVCAIGILPNPVETNGVTFDNSAMGADEGQQIPQEHDGIDGAGTDQVRLIRKFTNLARVQSRATLNGQQIKSGDYYSAVDEGFVGCYRTIVQLKNLWFSAGSLIDQIAESTVRVVLRPSSQYAALLLEASHPQLLGNALEQDLVFYNLSQSELPLHERTLLSEHRQLVRGDIPYFSYRPSSRDLYGADGDVIRDAFAESSRDIVRNRLLQMGDDDLEQQRWFIQASFASVGGKRPMRKNGKREFADFKSIALYAGDELSRTAVRTQGRASWVALRFASGTGDAAKYRTGLIEQDLYSGLSGVSLFLARLGQLTAERSYADLSKEAYRNALDQVELLKAKNSFGVFNGLGGLLYLQLALTKIECSGEYLEDARALAQTIKTEILKASSPVSDLISGTSGLIPLAAQAAKFDPDSIWDELGRAAFDATLSTGAATLPYQRGFAHGISGLTWALSFRPDLLIELRLRQFSELYELEENLLKITSTDIPGDQAHSAWCHGNIGIALARIGTYENLKEDQFLHSAIKCLYADIESRPSGNQTLCHGGFGNLEPLLKMSELFPNQTTWGSELQKQKTNLLEEINRGDLRSPLPRQLIEPGLMMGLAGMGYGALRVDAPALVPSVLTLSF